MENIEDRTERIAKKIVSGACNRKASVIHIQTEIGVEIIEIQSVDIIIESSRFNSSETIQAKRKIVLQRNKPAYPIQEIKRCLAEKSPKIKFKDRIDGKAYPERIGITREEAVEIIKNLNPKKILDGGTYWETLNNEKPVADVYKKFYRLKNGVEILLYIKFYLEGHKLVFVVSFHEDGE